MERTYTREQVEEILRRAALRSGKDGEPELTTEELVDAAEQAGIDADAVREAAEDIELFQNGERAVAQWQARRRRRVGNHALVWLVVCGGLMLLNLLLGGALWAPIVAVAWGIALALHMTFALRAPSPEALERIRAKQNKRDRAALEQKRAARAREAKRQAKVERRAARATRGDAASAFEAAVEEGVNALFEVAARSLSQAAARALEPTPKKQTEFDRFVAERKRRERGDPGPRVAERIPSERVRFHPGEIVDAEPLPPEGTTARRRSSR